LQFRHPTGQHCSYLIDFHTVARGRTHKPSTQSDRDRSRSLNYPSNFSIGLTVFTCRAISAPSRELAGWTQALVFGTAFWQAFWDLSPHCH